MAPKKLNILAVDDDIRMLRLLQMVMETEGYDVLTAGTGEHALDTLFGEAKVDLVMLDIGLPDMDGCDVCRRIREISQVPIIMVTAKDNDSEKVDGFNAGADDYVTKPFSAEELVARTKAVLRRSGQTDDYANRPAVVIGGDLEIDFTRRSVKVKGKEIALTATEYKVLFFLASNADRILTTDQILEHVWGEGYTGETNILQANIMRLRKKLGDDPRNPRYIITKMGIGYSMAKP